MLEDESDPEVLAVVLVREGREGRRGLDGPAGREVERFDAARDVDLDVGDRAVLVDAEIDLGLEEAADAGIDEGLEPVGRDLVGDHLQIELEGEAGDAERVARAGPRAAPDPAARAAAAAAGAEAQAEAGAAGG